ncbi:MAG: IS200/IS605 family transposase [Acidobacteria bacterium]|nr:IS200/IS605 family transposase [Acidobacteriota bacterium]
MAHTHTSLLYHIVFATKHRQPVIEEHWRAQLHQYLGGTVRGLEGIALEVGGVADHVHLLVSLNQNHCIADFMRELKASTSKWVNQSGFIPTRFEWQREYAAFSVTPSLKETVRRYIQRQEEHHREQNFEEEFIALLNAHQIEYDPKYLFD